MVRKVYTARNGARYIKLANGQCRFVSGASRQYLNRIRNMRGGNSGYELKLTETDPDWEVDLAQENLNELIPDYTSGDDATIDILNATSHEGSFYVKFRTNQTWASAAGVLIAVMQPRDDDSIMTVTNRGNGEVVFNKRMGDINWERPIWSV